MFFLNFSFVWVFFLFSFFFVFLHFLLFLFSDSVSGCTDYFAENEQEAFEMGRDIAETLPFHSSCTCESDPPLYDVEDIPSLISPDNKIDIYQVTKYCQSFHTKFMWRWVIRRKIYSCVRYQ
jgi:hypothetical protein